MSSEKLFAALKGKLFCYNQCAFFQSFASYRERIWTSMECPVNPTTWTLKPRWQMPPRRFARRPVQSSLDATSGLSTRARKMDNSFASRTRSMRRKKVLGKKRPCLQETSISRGPAPVNERQFVWIAEIRLISGTSEHLENKRTHRVFRSY